MDEEWNSSIYSLNDCIRSQSLFVTTATATDHERLILKSLLFSYHHEVVQSFRKRDSSKWLRRQYREERLKEEKSCLMTTDDEVLSELKQARYWTRQELKEQFHRAKQRN